MEQEKEDMPPLHIKMSGKITILSGSRGMIREKSA